MCVDTTSVLFVCMGNICRSPAAECFFRQAVHDLGIEKKFMIGSAGTGGWHAGNPPDRRMAVSAKKIGLSIEGSAQQITDSDISTYDWVFCMDQDNYDDVIAIGGIPEKTQLLLPFVGNNQIREVPDPYYGGDGGFDDVVMLINDAVKRLATMLSQ